MSQAHILWTSIVFGTFVGLIVWSWVDHLFGEEDTDADVR